jgi:light-regulated signal transduction histidine kinase (bacteriophytochrome)
MDIDAYLKSKSTTALMIIAVISTVFIGYVDYITGYEVRIDVFYLIPISFVAWYIGKKAGLIIATTSVLLIFLAALLSMPDYHLHFIEMWDLVMILMFFIVTVLLFSKLRAALHEQKLLALELRTALNDLKSTNKSLEAFSSSVSHDLRAPLRHIEAFAQKITDEYSDKLDETGKDYIRRISSNTRRMNDLIAALLRLSRYTRADLNRAKVSLSVMVKAAIAEHAQSRPERKVELVIADGVTAEGDPTMLQVVIDNLIGNAWKFTQKRPDAKIEFGVTGLDGKTVYYVRDNGAGFDKKYIAKLFSPFQRLHSDGEFPGIGIGLATVQRIIYRHGGRIWAEGETDRGATFYFTIS